jgi:diketogulonate reductase-like aldo/keto reductase
MATSVAARIAAPTAKVWTSGRQAGIRPMEDSMKKLRVERLDLMQVHNLVGTDTHLATFRDCKASSRVRHTGITHYHVGAHADLDKLITRGNIAAVQLNYSLAEPRLLRAAADSGTAAIVSQPFAEGAMFRRVKGKTLPNWAAHIGCASWAKFFLKWIPAQPAVTCVIPGTRKPKHAADNLGTASGPRPDEAVQRTMSGYLASL